MRPIADVLAAGRRHLAARLNLNPDNEYQPRHLDPNGTAADSGHVGEHRADHGQSFSQTPAFARARSVGWAAHPGPCMNAICARHYPNTDPWGPTGERP